jgi:hypothetical protein
MPPLIVASDLILDEVLYHRDAFGIVSHCDNVPQLLVLHNLLAILFAGNACISDTLRR